MEVEDKERGKIPDWEGDRYLGEIIRLYCPSLYGMPVYFQDGTRIPYNITIPLRGYISVDELLQG